MEEIFDYSDIKNIKMQRRNEYYLKTVERALDKKTFQNFINGNIIEENEINLIFEVVNKKTNMPKNYFFRYLDSINNHSEGQLSIRRLINTNNEMFENINILYFPTFRRIEEDVLKLKNESENRSFEGDLFEDIESEKHSGELIQFGMEDVKNKLDNLLTIIKSTSLDSFNAMTSKLLEQYLDNDFNNIRNLEFTKKNNIEIALSRVGKRISKGTREKILSMYDDNTLIKNKYLANLVMNIVDNYNNLKSIDNRIEMFVAKCNEYLYNKQMKYNPSELSLNIITTDENERNIQMENLSSGEKQLISTFSKVFLEDKKDLVVLFDEPELSLSIEWQKNFIYDLSKSDNMQLLIAVTHSPFIFDKLLDETTELRNFEIKESN